MFPGMGPRGMNPKMLNQMMKQFGITVEDLDDVEEVVIRTSSKEYVFDDATVTIMKAQGTETYQITGSPTVRERGAGAEAPSAPAAAPAVSPAAAAPAASLFSEEDVSLVAEQAGVSRERAREALAAVKGETAEAIVRLLEEKES